MRFRRGPGVGVADRAKVRASYVEEQMLGFAAGALELDQKEGIARYGPATLGESRHPSEIRLGFVGSGESVASAKDWFERAARGLEGEVIVSRRTKKPQKKLQDFPGSMPDRGFFSSIVAADHL